MSRSTLIGTIAAGTAAALAMFSGGCDTVRAPYAPGGDQVPATNYPKVAFADKELSAMLVVDPNVVVVDRPEGRPIKVTVPLRSVSEHTMKLQYQFYWRDALGRPVGESGWKFVRVEPRLQVPMQANATNQDAADWRMEVRFDR